MSLDRDAFENLRQTVEKEKAADKMPYEQKLQEKLISAEPQLVGTEAEKQAKREAIKKNFWLQHKPELDRKHKLREQFHWGPFGGEEKAREQMEEYEKQNQRDMAPEKLNKDWQKQQELAKHHEEQARQQDDKKKKEKEKQAKEQEQRQRQDQQKEQERQRRIEAIKQRRQEQDRGRDR